MSLLHLTNSAVVAIGLYVLQHPISNKIASICLWSRSTVTDDVHVSGWSWQKILCKSQFNLKLETEYDQCATHTPPELDFSCFGLQTLTSSKIAIVHKLYHGSTWWKKLTCTQCIGLVHADTLRIVPLRKYWRQFVIFFHYVYIRIYGWKYTHINCNLFPNSSEIACYISCLLHTRSSHIKCLLHLWNTSSVCLKSWYSHWLTDQPNLLLHSHTFFLLIIMCILHRPWMWHAPEIDSKTWHVWYVASSTQKSTLTCHYAPSKIYWLKFKRGLTSVYK